MIQREIERKNKEFENELRILRIICFAGGIVTPVVTYLWKYSYPDLKFSELNGWIFSCAFFIILGLSYRSSFVKKNVRPISYGMFSLSSLSGLYFAYINYFSAGYTLLMVLVIFAVIWIFNNPLHIMIYDITIFMLLAAAIYTSNKKGSDQIIILCSVAVFSFFSYLIARARYNVQIELKKSEDELKYISYHDKVTGLYNRAYFEEEKRRLEMDRHLPFGFIIGDVNSLKLTNDIFGHKKGDEILMKVARILKDCSRKEDIVARIGGDEFVIIMPNAGESSVQTVLKCIAEQCEMEKPDPIKPSLTIGYAIKTTELGDMDNVFKIAEGRMYEKKMTEGKIVRKAIIDSLMETIAKISTESEEHLRRVKDMAIQVAFKLRLTTDETTDLANLALLHDLGKIAVPEKVLNKVDRLTPDELSLIRQHSITGYRIATIVVEVAPIANYILHHHEHWDGNGYPYGLSKNEIPLLSRIISVINAYDAMTHDKPYRKRLTRDEAVEELKRCSGTQFDPEIVNTFLECISY